MSRLVVLLCRAELIAPRCSGRNRKSDGQQHEDGLQTQVGQLEDEEQRVANFQHEPADDQIRRRMLVLPGITGLWQVSGRSDLSWADSVRLDLSYVENWSMVGDLVIIASTLKAVLVGSGAY